MQGALHILVCKTAADGHDKYAPRSSNVGLTRYNSISLVIPLTLAIMLATVVRSLVRFCRYSMHVRSERRHLHVLEASFLCSRLRAAQRALYFERMCRVLSLEPTRVRTCPAVESHLSRFRFDLCWMHVRPRSSFQCQRHEHTTDRKSVV